jgi:FkbM family methyltransferase
MKKYRKHWLLGIRPALLGSVLKRLLMIKRRVVETDNGRFFIDPASNFGNGVLECEYEPEMTKTLKSLLVEGDTFVDLGANEGYFSVIASKIVGSTGKVICIEPQSRLQGIIFRNMLENKAFNIDVFQRAISDHIGIASLSLLPDMNTGGSGLFCATKYSVPKENVPQITLSRLLDQVCKNKIRLLKMDIEGLEHEAIFGSKNLFTKDIIENIALELHPALLERRGKSADEILCFLQKCGYFTNEKFRTLVLSKRIN